MAYVQSISGASAHNANLTQFTLTFPNVTASGNAIVVDLLYRTASGTMNVVDGAGNSFTKIFSQVSGSFRAECWYSVNIVKGVGVDTVYAEFSATINDIAMAIHEYANIMNVLPVDTDSPVIGVNLSQNAQITTGYDTELLHAFGATSPATGGSATDPITLQDSNSPWILREHASGGFEQIITFDMQFTQPLGSTPFIVMNSVSDFAPTFAVCLIAFKVPPSPLSPGAAWLIINEPVIRYTDRSSYIHLGGSSQSFSNILRQRGTANLTLYVKAGDTYQPTLGTQCFLYDRNNSGSTLVFAGTIDVMKISWLGTAGDRLIALSIVSFEQCFDALLVPPQTFYYQTAGEIFTSLYNSLCGGVPVVSGIVNASFVINSITCNWERLSDIFGQLATAASCVWGIDLATLSVFLQPISASPSPYTLHTSQVLWDSNEWEQNRQDFRDRQIIRISLDAFAQSAELFTWSGTIPATFTLMRPAETVTFAWLTKNTQNTATGTFTGNPNDGDTVTIGYPSSGSIYNWAPNAPYAIDQVIVDPANHIQRCTQAGHSGGGDSMPSWNDTGGNTNDFQVVWLDLGLSGPGGIGASVYTFKNVLDNRVWGQVLISPFPGQTNQNLADAINSNQTVAGQAFSWPTWENPLINADRPNGVALTLTIRNKSAGQGYIASLLDSASNFSWSAGQTSGGVTTFGTVSIQVAAQGSSNTANLYFTPGSAVVSVASVPSGFSGSGFLQVQYQRAASDCIVVEDTALVNLRAAIENGTGKYQQLVSDTSNTSNTSGLQKAQAALLAFSTIPISFRFKTLVRGLAPGQLLSISFSNLPVGINTIFSNGTYVVQEIQGDIIPTKQPLDSASAPGAGRFEYTVMVINVSQIFDYLEFWQQLGGSGGGGSVNSGQGLLQTSFGPIELAQKTVSTTPYAVVITDQVLTFAAGASVVNLPSLATITRHEIWLINKSGSTLTVNPFSGDTVNGLSAFPLYNGAYYQIIPNA